jgi:hypothetical protein
VLAGLHQQLGDPPQRAALLAEEEAHLNLLPWVRAIWIAHGAAPAGHDPRHQPALHRLRRRRPWPPAARFLYQVARKAVSATFTALLEQPLAAYPVTPVVAVVCDNVRSARHSGSSP